MRPGRAVSALRTPVNPPAPTRLVPLTPRPWEVCGTVEPEHDPLRHLTPEEREEVLGAIMPRKEADA